MEKDEIIKANLKFGDIIVLHSWKHLQEIFKHELDRGVENGNLVSPTGYRIFEFEKGMYDRPYRFTRFVEGQFENTINTIGKKEISFYEVKRIIKKTSKEYKTMEGKTL